MATGTAGTDARRYHQAMVHYLRADFTFAIGDNATITLGTIPANGMIIDGGVLVKTAFDAGTTNRLDIGTVADPDGIATLLALGTAGLIAADELATSNDLGPYASDTVITALTDITGTAATAGEGSVFVTYILNDSEYD